MITDKVIGWSILIAILAGILYLFGIGAFYESTPNHEFYLLGPKGALPGFLTFSLFMYTLFGVWFFFNGPVLHDTGRSYEFRPGVWGAVAIWIAMVIAVGIVCDMGYGFNACDNEFCKGDKDGRTVELRATRDQLEQTIKCPVCDHQQVIRDYWWTP